MYLSEEKARNSCGHYPWESEEVDGLEPGYRVCPMCAVMRPYQEKVGEQNRARQENTHGLTFGWFPPREDD